MGRARGLEKRTNKNGRNTYRVNTSYKGVKIKSLFMPLAYGNAVLKITKEAIDAANNATLEVFKKGGIRVRANIAPMENDHA